MWEITIALTTSYRIENHIENPIIENRLHQLGYVSRLNIWMPHELTEANLVTRIFICRNAKKTIHFLNGW